MQFLRVLFSSNPIHIHRARKIAPLDFTFSKSAHPVHLYRRPGSTPLPPCAPGAHRCIRALINHDRRIYAAVILKLGLQRHERDAAFVRSRLRIIPLR